VNVFKKEGKIMNWEIFCAGGSIPAVIFIFFVIALSLSKIIRVRKRQYKDEVVKVEIKDNGIEITYANGKQKLINTKNIS